MRNGYGASNIDETKCPEPSLLERAKYVLGPSIGFPLVAAGGVMFFPPAALPIAGAIFGLYYLGKAYGREQRKSRR